MNFGAAIGSVLAVIGIIIVSGLVIYALAALVVSIIDKREVKPFGPSLEQEAKQDEKLLLENKSYQLTFDDEQEEEQPKVQEEAKEVSNIDLDLADEEREAIAERRRIIETSWRFAGRWIIHDALR